MHREYDDDPIAALTTALRIALDAAGAGWDELIADPRIDTRRADALRSGDVVALDGLFAELNELRTIGP
jgi:hypothetical protein